MYETPLSQADRMNGEWFKSDGEKCEGLFHGGAELVHFPEPEKSITRWIVPTVTVNLSPLKSPLRYGL